MDIKEIIEIMKKDSNFEVKEVTGQPTILPNHILPDDVRLFYDLCGGVSIYTENYGFPVEILSPQEVQLANMKILGKQYEKDISSSWYLIADALDGNYISIDCDKNRSGLCYESFEYSHAVAGNCPIIALSFTKLLEQFLMYHGEYFFWKETDFKKLGDAYDKID